MKVTITSGKTEDGYWFEEMEIDGKERCCAYPLCECPEDAILERDLIGPTTIARYMKMAYEEGKAGRELEFEYIDDEE